MPDGLGDGTYFTIKTQGASSAASTPGRCLDVHAERPDWFGSDSFTVTMTDDERGGTRPIGWSALR